MPDVDVIVGQVVPLIGTAVAAYGAGVLTRVRDVAADATVRLGQRVLARILHRVRQRAPLEAAVADLAANGQDPDALAALRFQVRKILVQDPVLLREITEMLPAGQQASATGVRSVAVGGGNYGPVTTGDNSPIIGAG